jgi:hypothetical protein
LTVLLAVSASLNGTVDHVVGDHRDIGGVGNRDHRGGYPADDIAAIDSMFGRFLVQNSCCVALQLLLEVEWQVEWL